MEDDLQEDSGRNNPVLRFQARERVDQAVRELWLALDAMQKLDEELISTEEASIWFALTSLPAIQSCLGKTENP